MSSLNLKIISSKGLLLEEKIEMAVLPGYFGDIGITAGERVFIYLLKAGIVYLFNGSSVSSRYFVFNGRFKVEGEELIIATDYQIIDLSKMNREELDEKIKHYETLKSNTKDEILVKNYENNILAYKEALESEHVKLYK